MTQNVGIVIVEYEIKEIDRGVNGERGRTMDTHKFFVEKLRFHLNEPDMLVFVGWFYDGKASGREVQAYLDGEKLPAALTVNKGAEVRQKYLGTINEINEEVVGIVTLPKDWREKKKFEIFTDDGESKKRAYAVSTGKLRVRESRLEYYKTG